MLSFTALLAMEKFLEDESIGQGALAHTMKSHQMI
jgi:hypothetical protein